MTISAPVERAFDSGAGLIGRSRRLNALRDVFICRPATEPFPILGPDYSETIPSGATKEYLRGYQVDITTHTGNIAPVIKLWDSPVKPIDRLIFAVDTADPAEAMAWIDRLKGHVGLFKIGLELFCAAGPELVREAVARGGRVFLDLKFHDIPATVAGGLRSVSGLGAELTTVHIQAGQAWGKALEQAGPTKVLGISVLTSLSGADLTELDSAVTDPAELVRRRAALAGKYNLDGLVCSGAEAAQAREILGPDKLLVCPGIRPAWSLTPGDDQARVTTPLKAIAAGADYIVIGRPIRTADDPAEAADKVVAELAGA